MSKLDFEKVDFIPGTNSKNSSSQLLDFLDQFIFCKYKMAIIKYDGYKSSESVRNALNRIKRLYPERYKDIEIVKRGQSCYLLNKNV